MAKGKEIISPGAQRGLFDPQTFAEAERLAILLSKSDLVPKEFKDKPGNILIALQYGQEVGLKWLQAVQSIAVINGRPCMWGDAVLALIESSGLLDELDEHFETGKTDEDYAAVCSMKRRGKPKPYTNRFSVKDAKRAGLWGKTPAWTGYPQRMLKMRARGWTARDGFSDVLKGLWVREEAEDLVSVPSTVKEEPATGVLDSTTLFKKGEAAPPLATPTVPEVPPSDSPCDATAAEAKAPPGGTCFG